MECTFSLDLILKLNGKKYDDVIKALSTIILNAFQETDYTFEYGFVKPFFEDVKHIALYGTLHYQDKLITDQTVRAALFLLERNGMEIVDKRYMSFGDDEDGMYQ